MAKPRDLTVDGDLVRALAALLEETGLSEIDYTDGDRRIRVVRGAVPLAAPAPVAAAPVAAPSAPPEPTGTIRAPMVGTVYLSSEPGAPPFVAVGDSVREGQVLLLIEAMKVMNQIPAPRAGRVRQILVADAMPVEYGQPLLVVD